MDLHTSMVKLIQSVLGKYLPVPLIKDYDGEKLVNVPHTDRTKQLTDLDMFIGTQARVMITSCEEDVSQEKMKLFFRYVIVIYIIYILYL